MKFLFQNTTNTKIIPKDKTTCQPKGIINNKDNENGQTEFH